MQVISQEYPFGRHMGLRTAEPRRLDKKLLPSLKGLGRLNFDCKKAVAEERNHSTIWAQAQKLGVSL